MFRLLSILEEYQVSYIVKKRNTPLRNDSETATSLHTRSREAYPNAGMTAAGLTGKTETPEIERFIAGENLAAQKPFALRRGAFDFHRNTLCRHIPASGGNI